MKLPGGWSSVVVLVVIWAIFGYFATKPTDVHDFRKTAVQSAQSAYFSISTADLAVRAHLAGKTLDTYLHAVLDDASKGVSAAASEFAGEAPIDEATTRIRDELAPLLAAAVRALQELRRAEESDDQQALRRYDQNLRPLRTRLNRFIGRHR
jgi:hypothetical protein